MVLALPLALVAFDGLKVTTTSPFASRCCGCYCCRMTQSIDAQLEPIRHSPRLVEMVDRLQEIIRDERQRRSKFYEEMTPDQKIEFIEGEVLLHSPAKNKHLDVTMNVLTLLNPYVRMNSLGEVKCEKCLCVFPRNDYEPDVVFFGNKKAAKLKPNTMKFPIPDLIVEVLSDTTEERDRTVKYEDYEAHGVGEYWILDAEKCVAEQYLLRDSGYELALKSSSGELHSEVIKGLVLPVKAFFFPKDNLSALRGLLALRPVA